MPDRKRPGSWNVLALSITATVIWIKWLAKHLETWEKIFFLVLTFLLTQYKEDIDEIFGKMKRFIFGEQPLKVRVTA